MTEFGSFDNSMCRRVLDLLEPGVVINFLLLENSLNISNSVRYITREIRQ